MKRRISIVLVLLMLLSALTVNAAPVISAPRAILMEAESGLVLYSKHETERAYPASTTKVMTAILAVENGNFDDRVTVSFEAVNSISPDSSKAGWVEGEEVSFRDLVYTLMICSANDSANVIAEHISGSIDAFVEKMNARAAELGAENTHFVNTHGLHDEEHYTTAYDMAILARHAMTIPAFREIVRERSYSLAPTNKHTEERVWNSTNHLLNPEDAYYYEPAVGIKTGYTDAALSCLVSAAEISGATYIAVVFGAANDAYRKMSFADSRELLMFADQYCRPRKVCTEGEVLSQIPVAKAANGVKEIPAAAERTVQVVLPSGAPLSAVEKREYIKKNLTAPVKEGDIIGKMEYWYRDTLLTKTYLKADVTCEKANIFVTLFRFLFTGIWLYIILLICVILLVISRARKARNKKQRRLRAEMRRRNKY